jgi:hypothetical protein
MTGFLLIVAVTAVAILLFGQITGQLLSSPQTRALSRLVSAHRFRGPLEQAEAIGGIFSLYRLDASGTRDAKPSELSERRRRLIEDAARFDQRYGKFNGDVRVSAILKQEIGVYLDGEGPRQS